MVGVGEDVHAVCPPKILCFWGGGHFADGERGPKTLGGRSKTEENCLGGRGWIFGASSEKR